MYAQYHVVMGNLSSESEIGLWDTSSLGFAMVGNKVAEEDKDEGRLNPEQISAEEFCSQKVISCRFRNRRPSGEESRALINRWC